MSTGILIKNCNLSLNKDNVVALAENVDIQNILSKTGFQRRHKDKGILFQMFSWVGLTPIFDEDGNIPSFDITDNGGANDFIEFMVSIAPFVNSGSEIEYDYFMEPYKITYENGVANELSFWYFTP